MCVRYKQKKWTEELIIDKLTQHLFSSSTTRYFLNNLYVFPSWESDFLTLTKSGYFYEGEVKISRSDFKADFKKETKHLILEDSFNNKMPENSLLCPHYHFYAVPEGLIKADEIPEYSGLIYMVEYYPYYKWVKKPPLLHKVKYDDNVLNLQDKFYYNMVSWKNRALKDYKDKIEEYKNLLNESKTDENGKKYKYTLSEYDDLLVRKNEEILNLKQEILYLKDSNQEYLKELRDLKRNKKRED